MKFVISFKAFYLALNFRYRSHMEEAFGLAVGNYYTGYYYGDGWCAGKLDSNGCLNE